LRQLENVGTLQTVEIVGQMAQFDQGALDYINVDQVVKNTAYSNAVPMEVLRSDYEVKQIRANRAKAQQQQQEMQANAEMAKAYSQTNAAPEEGSPADLLMKQG